MTTFPLKPGVSGAAKFVTYDGAQVARLSLHRWWDIPDCALDESGKPADDRFRPLVIIGKNPSNAGADVDDNTSAACTDFAIREGANGLVIVNLHPGIATDPKGLGRVLLPYNTDEQHWDAVDAALSTNAVKVVAAWGKAPPGMRESWRDRADKVKRIAWDVGVGLWCFGRNGDGSPRHPQYLPKTQPIVPYWSGR